MLLDGEMIFPNSMTIHIYFEYLYRQIQKDIADPEQVEKIILIIEQDEELYKYYKQNELLYKKLKKYKDYMKKFGVFYD